MQTLTHTLKLCSVILRFLGIFDMAKLYVIRWAFIFPRLTKFQENKILSGCFKFKNLNLGLAEAIEILKTTAYTILQCSLLTFFRFNHCIVTTSCILQHISQFGSFSWKSRYWISFIVFCINEIRWTIFISWLTFSWLAIEHNGCMHETSNWFIW